MRRPRRVLAAALMAIAAVTALGAPAVAAPMPWDSHRAPATAPAALVGEHGSVSALCVGGCYQ